VTATIKGPSRMSAVWQASAVSERGACSFSNRRLDLRPRNVAAFDAFSLKGSNRGALFCAYRLEVELRLAATPARPEAETPTRGRVHGGGGRPPVHERQGVAGRRGAGS